MVKTANTNLGIVVLGGLLLVGGMPVIAEEATTGRVLEEIIVTAEKRESTLMDTSMAVSAFTADTMEDMDINNPLDMEALVPSFTFRASPNRISIRGVGRFDNSMGTQPGVAVYTDGVYLAESTALYQHPINLQRTEILRGPQGTLYGRNTTGGAVNVITKRPTDEFELDLRVKAGNYGAQEFAGVITGPITDNIGYKLYLLDTQRDGIQNNLAGKDTATVDTRNLEVQLEWDVTENLNAWLKYTNLDYTYIPIQEPLEDPYDCANYYSGLGLNTQFFECLAGHQNPSMDDPFTVSVNHPGEIKLRNNDNTTLALTYDFADATLKYLVNQTVYDWDYVGVDYDGTANPVYQSVLDIGQYQTQTTNELQLTSTWDRDWQYILGLYYFDDENDQPYNIRGVDQPQMATVTQNYVTYWANPQQIYYFQRGSVDNTSWAFFGEVNYQFNEQWAVTVGARYSDDEYHGEENQLQYFDLALYGLPFALDVSQGALAGDPTRYVDTVDASYDESSTNVTGKLTVDYRPLDDHLIWLTMANGYKMGGVRLGSLEALYSNSAGVTNDGKFDQEDVLMVELGWKADLLDNRFRAEAVLFNSTYDSMQQLQQFQTPEEITLARVVNVDMAMWGVELSGTYIVNDNLMLMANYSHNASEVDEDAYFQNTHFGARDAEGSIIPDNIKGNRLVLTPLNKGALSAQYTYPTSIGEFMLGGSYAYVGQRYFDIGNYISEGSYTRLDMQAAWTSNSGQYKLLAAVNNATDEEVNNSRACSSRGSGTPTFTGPFCTRVPMDPRLYTLQFIFRL